jgi:hypothetical protein
MFYFYYLFTLKIENPQYTNTGVKQLIIVKRTWSIKIVGFDYYITLELVEGFEITYLLEHFSFGFHNLTHSDRGRYWSTTCK